jgi:hypothetical protein
MQHVSTKPAALSKLVRDIPNEIENLIMGMLEKNPDKRVQEASSVSESLGLHVNFQRQNYT